MAHQAAGCQTQWPTFRHDQQDTGNYDFDGTPPAAVAKLRVSRLAGGGYRLSFVSPGDSGSCGQAAAYVVSSGKRALALRLGHPVRAGRTVSRRVALARGVRALTVQARNRSGLLGIPVTVAVPRATGKRSR